MGCLALRPPVCHSSSPDEVRPSTGEPDAGDPLVRFGGRGGAIQCAVPTPIVSVFFFIKSIGKELDPRLRGGDDLQKPR